MLRAIPAVLLALLLPTTARAAETVVLAPAPEAAGLTAQDGHVVFSQRDPVTAQWSLMRWHAGVVDRLPVAPRSVPFDADAGTDAAGRPVVTFSRCAHEPGHPDGLLVAAHWSQGGGCDLRLLPLTGEVRERALPVPGTASWSETTPSMWRGTLAYARHTDGLEDTTIRLLPHGATRTRRLGGGSVPACSGCRLDDRSQSVAQMDLGPSRVAYLWEMSGSGVYGTGIAWELRAAPASGGRSTLLDTGLISGMCGFREPVSPTATSPISYLEASAACDVTGTRFAVVDPVSGRRATAPTPDGLAAAIARDGATTYWLRATDRAHEAPVPGARTCAVARCELVATTGLSFEAQRVRAEAPPAFVDLLASDLGYRWVPGPLGTRLLRPPARLPCAPSARGAASHLAATWSGRRTSLRLLRTFRGRTTRVGAASYRTSFAPGTDVRSILRRCGDRARFTYVVRRGRAQRRMSFTVTRARLRR